MANFLRHVHDTVPAYRQTPLEIGIDAFPAISRRDVASSPNDFVSSAFAPSACWWKSTSGSTGVPLVIPRDRAAIYGFLFDGFQVTASIIPAFRKAIEPGRLAVALIEDHPDRKPSAAVLPDLEYGILQRLTIGLHNSMDRLVLEYLRSRRIPLLYGRPRALLELLRLDRQLEQSGGISPCAILCSGDNLHEDVRLELESGFSAIVHNAYVSNEGGFIGIDCVWHNGMHVLTDRVKVEVRSEDGLINPHGDGEFVISNLENWAMPFVRYRTGDSGTVEQVACRCGFIGTSISNMRGRDSTYFLVGERRLNPSKFNRIFEHFAILQFQVRQQSEKSLIVTWLKRDLPEVDEEGISNGLKRKLEELEPFFDVQVTACKELSNDCKKVQRYVREF